MSARFDPPSIHQRGQVARAMAAAYQQKPEAGEYKGRMPCPRCGSGLQFSIMSNGLSRGRCNAACGVSWVS